MKENITEEFPDLSPVLSKSAVKYVSQLTITNKVLLGLSQGIGNVIMATPLIRALTSMNLEVDVLMGGFLNGAEMVLIKMPGVCLVDESFAENQKYLIGLQTVWPLGGLEKFCTQVRSAGNIQSAWNDDMPVHEVELNMALAYSLKYNGDVPDLYCYYERVDFNYDQDVKNIGIHICRKYSTQFWANRQLINPLELGICLLRRGYKVFILGHKGCVSEEDKQRYPDFRYEDGKDLKHTAGIIKELDCMINEDSGIMHVTAAMDTPQVAIFGPTSEIKNRPWSDKAMVVRQKLNCAPCQYAERANTCYNNVCMDITPKYIISRVKFLIDKFPKKTQGGEVRSISSAS